MCLNINSVELVGKLAQDIELKTTTTGLTVCNFTLEIERDMTRPGPAHQFDYIRVTAWRQQAEYISKCEEGDFIAIRGAIQTRSYTDKNGEKKYITEVIADRVSFWAPNKETQAEPNTEELPLDEDVPF